MVHPKEKFCFLLILKFLINFLKVFSGLPPPFFLGIDLVIELVIGVILENTYNNFSIKRKILILNLSQNYNYNYNIIKIFINIIIYNFFWAQFIDSYFLNSRKILGIIC